MGDTERTISNSSIGALLGFVDRCYGADTVAEVLAVAGDPRPLSELQDPTFWSTSEEADTMFDAARQVTGDESIARQAGAELLTHYASSEVIALIRSLETLGDAFALIAETASKSTTALRFACEEISERHALVSARRAGRARPASGRTCLYTEGVFSSLPTLFGIPAADVSQVQCTARGDTQCLFRIHWDPSAAADPAVQAHFLRQQVDALTRRFEALEEMASELASVTDVDELLRQIIHRSGVAVRAPRYLMVVTLPGDRRPRVHHVGFSAEEAERAAAELLSGAPDDEHGSRLVVDVTAAGTRFGRLGAFFPTGHRFLPTEHRLLAAYAGHAAAALQAAAAMADRQRQVETNAALLDLAASLAEVTTTAQVAARLVEAVPGVVGCTTCVVLVWEPDDGHLVVAGPAPPAGCAARVPLSGSTRRRLAGGGDSVLTTANMPELRALRRICATGDDALAVPVIAGSTLQAVIVLAGHGVSPAGAELDLHAGEYQAILAGVAGLAATAFHNARLLQRIEHQAQHDPLTGLANLRLFRELVTAALANARRRGDRTGLLFIDLDRFKAVNDQHGHAAGDAVLAQVAQRVQRAVRSGDTAARLGGDEFVVLLPVVRDEAEATGVADRILDLLRRPITSPGGPVRLSASVGIMLAGETGFDEMLSAADSAMYRAKAAGGGRWVSPASA